MQPPAFGPPMAAHQVRGDPEQPREGVGKRAVVAPAGGERARERLRGDLLGGLGAYAPLREGVHGGEMAIEHGAERRRLVQRAADRVCVGGRHVTDCPFEDARFHRSLYCPRQ
jgi:hypothetical protein